LREDIKNDVGEKGKYARENDGGRAGGVLE